ncbi:MAG TPA: VOC family protein [Nocardioides sp.]|jgi:PhnB protein|uniref:VOC family protein n=1 Tax=Nocardioides sp. TaxID=35761 RepID=UPI002D0393EE|nr:VOC family protein [Nocardioides sp.]HTW16305.1 VOC family protein [Nocardioides sp.]
MTTILNPYLHFDGTAREALTFYHSLFGGELSIMTYGDMGMEGEQAAQVMHGSITNPGGITLMASDGAPGEKLVRGNASNLSLSGEDDAGLRGWFEALSDGGEVHVPLEKQMWGDVFGQVQDRFGVIWLVNITQPA